MSFSPLLLYVTLPLWLAPHRGGVLNISDREKKYLVMLRDTAEEKGIYISLSPPVFCAAKYRGSARRARGLIQTKTPPKYIAFIWWLRCKKIDGKYTHSKG